MKRVFTSLCSIALLAACGLVALSCRAKRQDYMLKTTRIDVATNRNAQRLFYSKGVSTFPKLEVRRFKSSQAVNNSVALSNPFEVRVRFQNLTRTQFDTLMTIYGGKGRSKVEFAEGRSYPLSAFFPPIVQATQGRLLSMAAQSNKIGVQGPQGYGLAFEFLRGDPNGFVVFSAPQQALWKAIEVNSGVPSVKLESEISSKVLELVPDPNHTKDKNFSSRESVYEALLPGDVMSIWHPTKGPIHSAIVADKDLFFEGFDTGDGVGFRCVRYADLLAGLRKDVGNPTAEFTYKFRRFKSAGFGAAGVTFSKEVGFQKLGDYAYTLAPGWQGEDAGNQAVAQPLQTFPKLESYDGIKVY